MGDRQVSRSVLLATPPEPVFDLLADPSRHAEVDGSGSVRKAVKGPDRLALGSRFAMSMKLGLPYRISNEVVEFEENRRIAWRHFGHHVWRYELEPVDGGTRVTETFDYAPARAPALLERLGMVKRNERSIDATLERLRERFGSLS
jgi:uncharacterized protein YndB with AHSA1/START domain